MPSHRPGTVTLAAGAFKATDEYGKDVMILVFQEFSLVDNEVDGGGGRGSPGAKSMKLATGEDITKTGDGEYVTSRGLKLSSTDPNRLCSD